MPDAEELLTVDSFPFPVLGFLEVEEFNPLKKEFTEVLKGEAIDSNLVFALYKPFEAEDLTSLKKIKINRLFIIYLNLLFFKDEEFEGIEDCFEVSSESETQLKGGSQEDSL